MNVTVYALAFFGMAGAMDEFWKVIDVVHSGIVDIRFNYEGETGRLGKDGTTWDGGGPIHRFTAIAAYHCTGVVRREIFNEVEGGVEKATDSLRLNGEWRLTKRHPDPTLRMEESASAKTGAVRLSQYDSFVPYFAPAYFKLMSSKRRSRFAHIGMRRFDGRNCETLESRGDRATTLIYLDMERGANVVGEELYVDGKLAQRMHHVELKRLDFPSRGSLWFPIAATRDSFADEASLRAHKVVTSRVPKNRNTYRALSDTVVFNAGVLANDLEVVLDPRFRPKVVIAKGATPSDRPMDGVELPADSSVTKEQFETAFREAKLQEAEFLSRRPNVRSSDSAWLGYAAMFVGGLLLGIALYRRRA